MSSPVKLTKQRNNFGNCDQSGQKIEPKLRGSLFVLNIPTIEKNGLLHRTALHGSSTVVSKAPGLPNNIQNYSTDQFSANGKRP